MAASCPEAGPQRLLRRSAPASDAEHQRLVRRVHVEADDVKGTSEGCEVIIQRKGGAGVRPASPIPFLRRAISEVRVTEVKRPGPYLRAAQDGPEALVEITRRLLHVATSILVLLSVFLGIPDPLLWGVLTVILSFAPYVGEMAIAVTLFVISSGQAQRGHCARQNGPPEERFHARRTTRKARFRRSTARNRACL